MSDQVGLALMLVSCSILSSECVLNLYDAEETCLLTQTGKHLLSTSLKPFFTLSCAADSALNEVHGNPKIHLNIHPKIPAAEFWLDPHK